MLLSQIKTTSYENWQCSFPCHHSHSVPEKILPCSQLTLQDPETYLVTET